MVQAGLADGHVLSALLAWHVTVVVPVRLYPPEQEKVADVIHRCVSGPARACAAHRRTDTVVKITIRDGNGARRRTGWAIGTGGPCVVTLVSSAVDACQTHVCTQEGWWSQKASWRSIQMPDK